jgi:hypothetical protein
MVLSIGIFFTLIILGLASSLPTALSHGLIAQGVPRADAARVAALPPVSVMFAALLGYNPVQTLLGPAIAKLPASHAAFLTGRSFFPALISPSFSNGLHIAFDFAIAACLIAAIASLLRGGRYVHEEHVEGAVEQVPEAGGPGPGEDRRRGGGEDRAVESGRGKAGRPPATASLPEDTRTAGLRR